MSTTKSLQNCFFVKKKKISFFVLMISSLMFTRTNHVVYAYFTSSCWTFFNYRMTKKNISIMLNVMNVLFRHDTFAIFHVIYEIIWNIVFNVKFIKSNVMHYTNFYNQYWRRQFFFHIIIINFILILFVFKNDFDVVMSIFDKFIKRVIIVIDKNTWFVVEWKTTLLNRLNIVDWDLLKTIISNKNFQFFSNFWKTVFKKLNVLLLYFIAYHFQTNDQSKRINQTMKITLRFLMTTMNDFTQWSKMLSKIQRYINNVNSITIDKNLNEIFYDFTSIQIFDLWTFFSNKSIDNETSQKFNFFIAIRVRVKIVDFIVFV